MISIMHATRWFLVLSSIAIFSLTGAAAADWPDGYIVYEKSSSPNEQYGILIPSRDAAENDESLGEVNYLADLKTHQLMGKIRGADYFEHQNHRGLQVIWAPDSTWCVVEYEDRFGFGSIWILEPKGSTFTQTDIGERINKSLAAVITKKSHDPESSGGDAAAYFRLSSDRNVRVRAVSTTNPKEFENQKSYYALFQGTFDLRLKKWTVTDARTLNYDEYTALETAFEDHSSNEGVTYASVEDQAKSLDESMNQVYQGVRLILPANRFEKIKADQIEWLKKRDAENSIEEKCKLMEARTKTLQDLLW